MTTIIAGKVEIKGELRNFATTETTLILYLYVDKERITDVVIMAEMPLPNMAMLDAMKNAGIRGLANATIDLNHNRIRISTSAKYNP